MCVCVYVCVCVCVPLCIIHSVCHVTAITSLSGHAGAGKHHFTTTVINKLAPKLFLIKISFDLCSNEFIMAGAWGGGGLNSGRQVALHEGILCYVIEQDL